MKWVDDLKSRFFQPSRVERETPAMELNPADAILEMIKSSVSRETLKFAYPLWTSSTQLYFRNKMSDGDANFMSAIWSAQRGDHDMCPVDLMCRFVFLNETPQPEDIAVSGIIYSIALKTPLHERPEIERFYPNNSNRDKTKEQRAQAEMLQTLAEQVYPGVTDVVDQLFARASEFITQ